MATLEELEAEVTRKVRDDAYTSPIITGFFNQCLLEIAGVLRIPALKTSDNAVTVPGQPYTDLPEDYHFHDFNPIFVRNTTRNKQERVYRAREYLLTDFPDAYDQSGAIEGVFVEPPSRSDGRALLHYARTPSASEVLKVHYFKQPTVLSAPADIPVSLPIELHRPLLVNYACREIFEEIYEGDAEGARTVQRYENNYNKAFARLQQVYPPHRPPESPAETIHWSELA